MWGKPKLLKGLGDIEKSLTKLKNAEISGEKFRAEFDEYAGKCKKVAAIAVFLKSNSDDVSQMLDKMKDSATQDTVDIERRLNGLRKTINEVKHHL